MELANGNRFSQLKPSIRARIQKAVQSLDAFHVMLKADALGVFSHAQRRETIWLDVSTPSVHQLQAALQAEFLECNVDQGPYTPHLSVGQVNSLRGAHK
jgi:2'-5' RNA ligase